MKALVVLSGGQDSTTCAVIACAEHGAENVAAITFDYNQRHSLELLAAQRIAALLGITQHEVLKVGPILQGTSPLTSPGEQLETYTDYKSMDKIIGDRVEKTFVPMRNALFLTLAANRAACMGAQRIYTGVCQADNANYPDCRQVFIDAQVWAINYALGAVLNGGAPSADYFDTNRAIHIDAPLMDLSKAESISLLLHTYGWESFALLAFSHTAYDGTYPPVSKDHASVLRAHGFEEAMLPDPLVVRAHMEGLMELPNTSNYKLLGDLQETIGKLKDRLGTLGMPYVVGHS